MDCKHGPYYPVFMINDQYGGRGLNFRAQNNPHGITLLILGPFLDEKTMKQVLQRVGRWNDKCFRVRDCTCELFDAQKNAERKGEIEKFLTKLREQKFKRGLMGDIKVNSQAQFQDGRLSSGDYLKK